MNFIASVMIRRNPSDKNRQNMRWTIGRRVALGYVAVIGILCGAGSYAIYTMKRGSEAMSEISQAYLPEMQLASAFEREVLNARIHFIYHVTIQKPGALEKGWQRYGNARALMPKLVAQAQKEPLLAGLREPTRELAANLDAYEVLLNRILDVVAKRENQGEAFARLVADWAAMGGKLVDSAGNFNAQCTGIVAAESDRKSVV